MSAAVDNIEDDPYCRICRSGTEDGDLFHPCKCRGSVKYVHEDCLKEWLKSSGNAKTVRRCDICGHEYEFRSILRGDAPTRLNAVVVAFMVLRLKLYDIYSQYSGSLLALVLFGLTLPMLVMFAIRFYSIMLDFTRSYVQFNTEIKYPERSLYRALLAGNVDTVPKEFEYTWKNIWECLKYTYPKGAKCTLTMIVLMLQTILLHEGVTKDKGFVDLMNLRVGDPSISEHADRFIRDFLQHVMQDGIDNFKISRLELERLIDLHEMSFMAQFRNLAVVDLNDVQLEREYAKLRRQAREKIREVVPFLDDFEPLDPTNPDQPITFRQFDLNMDAGDEEEEEEHDLSTTPQPEVSLNDFAAEAVLVQNEESSDEGVGNISEEEDEDIYSIEDEEADVESDVEDELLEELAGGGLLLGFNLRVEVQVGLVLFAIISLILVMALGLLYYLPSFVGHKLFVFYYSLVYSLVSSLGSFLWSQQPLKDVYYKISNRYLDIALGKLAKIVQKLDAVYREEYPVSFTGRLVPLLSVLFTLFIFANIVTYILERPYRQRLMPVKGTARRIYYLFFDVLSVLKVNVIFASEIVAFPAICGVFLDFVLSPIFVESDLFIPFDDTAFTTCLFFDFVKNDKFFLFLCYWGTGTLYMCLFATYVGMIRKFILRPGVLFFIRSPDDQNTRLIHDALVRPFRLQMSRIFLSGRVYTIFILVGFGILTFPIRYFTVLLPIKLNVFSTFFLCSSYIYAFHKYSVLRKYVRIYWFYAIKKAAALTRLSSFILGIDSVAERGRVVYRSWSYRLFKREEPDYNNPIDEEDVDEFFQSHPELNSVFIPDGYWFKVPDNDNVSRLYLRKLFYPTRQDGTEFEEYRNRPIETRIDNLLGEKDEIDDIVSHTIAFRPPQFELRNVCFVFWIWFFAALLICTVILTSHFIGLPISMILYSCSRKFPSWLPNIFGLGFSTDHEITNVFQLSYSSIIFGFTLELTMLNKLNSLIKIRSVKSLKKGKPLFDRGRLFKNQEMVGVSVEAFGSKLTKIFEVIAYFSLLVAWAVYLILIQKFFIVSILENDGLGKDLIEQNYKYLTTGVDYSELWPLVKIFCKYLSLSISQASFQLIVLQSVVGLAIWPPFTSALIHSKDLREFSSKLREFLEPQLLATTILSINSVYKTGSILPGLTGEIDLVLWELAFSFALFVYLYGRVALFYSVVIIKNEEEMRAKHYLIGEELLNCPDDA